MSTAAAHLDPPVSAPVVYPSGDGKPMADTTLQYDWIVRLKGGVEASCPTAFVAGDLLWYYEEGNPRARVAPDGLIAFGRPPGYRGSYMQWVEDGVCPQVVFEVLSPKNTAAEMQRKYALYARLGCLEYYLIDPYLKRIEGFERAEDGITFIADAINRWSPLLGLRLRFDDEIFRFADDAGNELPTMTEAIRAADEAVRAADEAVRAADEAVRAVDEAEAGRTAAVEQLLQATARADALAAKLRSLGIDTDG